MTTLRINRNKWILSFEERYFEPVPPSHAKDLTIYYQAPDLPVNQKFSEYKTLHIDLTQSEDQLLKDMAKNNRYKVNRFFSKDKFNCQIISEPNIDMINTFASFYNVFAASKGLSTCNTQKIKRLTEKSGIIFSVVKDHNLKEICYHSYIVNGMRARLYHTVSQFREIKDNKERNLIARANRGLHWFDMKYFKSEGYQIYDMGGLADLNKYPEMASINKFKKDFGGKEIIEYNVYCPNSILGRMAIFYLLHINKSV